jgi:catechol 2,3-dioxygenase-like lactoylglutathione lyase family enzyme
MAMITSFSHIYLPVRDVEQSIDFYTKNLGFRLLRKYRTTDGGNPSAYVELGEVLLELTQARQPLPGDESRVEPRIGLTVTDMDAVIKDLQSKGVQVEREPFDARTFWGSPGHDQGPLGLRHFVAGVAGAG